MEKNNIDQFENILPPEINKTVFGTLAIDLGSSTTVVVFQKENGQSPELLEFAYPEDTKKKELIFIYYIILNLPFNNNIFTSPLPPGGFADVTLRNKMLFSSKHKDLVVRMKSHWIYFPLATSL